MAEDNRNKPLYMISVAAELTGMHPQTLRVYESKGLVNPQRSGGNTRLYSRADIERLELINQLTDEGINLAGVVRILDMKERAEERERENEKLRARVRQLEDELHEYKMQKKITALVPRDGSVYLNQVMLGKAGLASLHILHDALQVPEVTFRIEWISRNLKRNTVLPADLFCKHTTPTLLRPESLVNQGFYHL